MAKITIEELSGSLKEYLNGLGLTEAQVQELIDKFEDEKIGDISQLSTDEKGSLVGAINELFQNANNGKELIANAIGEPLSSEDTFSAMSNDINGLLSTFKTNMMNNGITVESSDKFKSLIDKIATLADNEGKGIQFASGDFTLNVPNNGSIGSNTTGRVTQTVTFDKALDFEWTYFFIGPFNLGGSGSGNQYGNNLYLCGLKNPISTFLSGNGRGTVSAIEFSSTGFTLAFNGGYSTYLYVWNNEENIQWYAIGVGEEDTTLRDSLASILQEEGVSVSEEDDMASLISKVDSEFDRQVVPQGNASVNQVLQGSTFMNSSGQLQTGTIPYLQSNVTNAVTHYMTGEIQIGDYSGLGGNCIYFAMPTGVYNTVPWIMTYCPDLRSENIVSGKNVLGVWGTYSPATYSITSYPNPDPYEDAPEGYSAWCDYTKQVATSTFHEYTSPIAPGTGTYYVYIEATYVSNLELQFVRSDGSIAAQGTLYDNGGKIFTLTMPANMAVTVRKVSGTGAIVYIRSYYIINILS